MTALFERALGDDWSALHPRLRERYGVAADDEIIVVGEGTMDRIARSLLAAPVLWLGTLDDFVFPEQGRDVAFTIRSEHFVDDAGNEAVHLDRRFAFPGGERRFVDTLRWNPARECITDCFGHRGLVASDIHLGVEDGDLVVTLGRQWLRLGRRYLPVPGPLGARGTLRDGYDEDAKRYRVAAAIGNPLLGDVFAYEGGFANRFEEASAEHRDATATESRLGDLRLPGA
jgi:hypothetical protein